MAPLASLNVSTGPCKAQNGPSTYTVQAQAVHTNSAIHVGGQALPPNFYGVVKWSVKCNGNQVISFADQADFPCISEQKDLYDALITVLKSLNHSAADDLSHVKSFVFTNAIIQIEEGHQEAQCKQVLEEVHVFLKHLLLY
ncbi:hypothetical protein C0995_012572 [Termitomyces sp. Mi166|nr:hypothetical protein C0995_012572 [Termitomyces sp. Mi166\